MTQPRPQSGWRRWLPWLGALIGIATLAWILRGFDLTRFRAIVANVDATLLLAVPVAIAAEQLVRAWKWRQLLYRLRSISTFRLFGAIMAGYLMEISPDDRRPAYSGYFNVLVAPAALLLIAGGALMHATSAAPLFALSLAAAVLQFLAVRRLRVMPIASTVP